jgi:methylmalonyl-CoA mutase
MPENPIHSKLRETFVVPDKEQWKQIASQELDGKNPDEILAWNSEEGIPFFSYYDDHELSRQNVSSNFRLTVAEDPYFGPAKWLNLPRVTVTSEKTANQTAHQHLINGADGIIFTLTQKISVDRLLDGIDWQYCSLFFQAEDQNYFRQRIAEYCAGRNLSVQSLNGGLFWDTLPKINPEDTDALKNILSIKSSTAINEIADALLVGTEVLSNHQAKIAATAHNIAFSINVNQLFLENIAKLKALRMLWFQVVRAFGVNEFQSRDLFLHTRSEKWIKEKFQPHGNMLNATTACMSAIMGGANAVTIHPEDESNMMMTRIARNVSNLVREEAHFDKVSDPVAGAYAIDAMVISFAKEAWKIFQQKQTR